MRNIDRKKDTSLGKGLPSNQTDNKDGERKREGGGNGRNRKGGAILNGSERQRERSNGRNIKGGAIPNGTERQIEMQRERLWEKG